MSQKKQSDHAAEQSTDAANKWREMAEEEAKFEAESDIVDAEGVNIDEEPVEALDEVSKKKLTDLTNNLEREIEKYKNEALRTQAEMENLRRRMDRDISNAHKFGSEKLVVDLLPVVDGLVRGIEETNVDDEKVQNVRKGMELTLDMLLKTLEKNGVSEINPARGDAFDPEQHEAMSMQPDPEADANTILQVFQRGYSLNGRVIRAAMVMVAS